MDDDKSIIKKISEKDNSNNKILNNYVILEKIGSGSFGEVYLAKELKHNILVAAKIEERASSSHSNSRIKYEYEIYEKLYKRGFTVGIPKIYQYIQTTDFNILFMQLLGPSLDEIFNKYQKKFKLCTVYQIGIQIISLLEKLHESRYIHRDIKPNNFLIGYKNDKDKIYIMDFGLSKQYMDKTQKHMQFRIDRSLVGTARYASINMHMGIEPSRRDDLESVGYMLIYFIRGNLPWQGIKIKNTSEHISKIGEKKMCTSVEELCKGLPKCFLTYINYCRDLNFDQIPDYDYLKMLLFNSAKKQKIIPHYEWCN